MAQALGVSADDGNAKFQRGRRYPSLAAMAAKLNASGGDKEPLTRLTALNVVLGNTDAHAKNQAVLLDERGRARLALAYDVAPLLTFRQPRFALDIAGRSLVGGFHWRRGRVGRTGPALSCGRRDPSHDR